MTHHEPIQTESEADASFERLLLRSASADHLPEGATREAWAKFASASAGVALVATGAPGLGLLRAARRASLKWLAVGAIGGSAITAAWLGSRTPAVSTSLAPSSLPPEQVAPLSARRAAPSAAQPAPQITPKSESTILKGEQPPILRPSQALKQASARPSPGPTPRAARESSASSLAAEVAALDAIQKAFTSQEFARAVRLVDAYQREFPRGQLAPDADVLAIEALAAQGSRAELELRAERFLIRYPKDPHRARIATLLEP